MSFECLEDCGKCCGVVVIPAETWASHLHVAFRLADQPRILSNGDVFPVTTDGKCCFLGMTKTCTIYADRPRVCREFGESRDEALQCPFLKPNGYNRSPASRRRIERIQQRRMNQR